MTKKMLHYSQGIPKILNEKDRLRIAKQIFGVLKVHLGEIKNLSCLDVACSGGIITNHLAGYFKSIVGIDIDSSAIKFAKKNFRKRDLKFYKMSAENIRFNDETFDVAICNQVYNFVENPPKLMSEIYRILKPGGVCFFSARNKYTFWEPQYNLPFLSWFPTGVAEFYIRVFGRGNKYFGKNYLGYFGLKNLVSKFKTNDYTLKILRNPEKYGFDKLKNYSSFTQVLPLGLFLYIIPNYIWVLEKK